MESEDKSWRRAKQRNLLDIPKMEQLSDVVITF